MKKIIMLGLLSVSLFGCSEQSPVEIDEIDKANNEEVDFTQQTATYIEEDKVSADMYQSIADMIKIKNDLIAYLNKLDLPNRSHINSEPDKIGYLRDLKYKLDSIQLNPITEADNEVYDAAFNYQYNMSQCMDYMMQFLYKKDQSILDMYTSYVDDLEYSAHNLQELQEKYNIY